MFSIAGIAYDVLDFVHPGILKRHNGMKFSTLDADYDTHPGQCAFTYGGGWWYNTCGVFNAHGTVPSFYSPPDGNWYVMLNTHMMIKMN